MAKDAAVREADQSDAALREHLTELLRGESAHAGFDKAIAGLPAKLRGARVPNVPFTAWQLLEHMRIAQWDILEFSRNAKHVSPKWPEEYWPKSEAPVDGAAWDASVATFHEDAAGMTALVQDPDVNLFARIPHGTGQTVLREAMLVADHNSYHVGQLILLRRLLGAWGE
jgi:uncharacterized damage-inducible protein DinB